MHRIQPAAKNNKQALRDSNTLFYLYVASIANCNATLREGKSIGRLSPSIYHPSRDTILSSSSTVLRGLLLLHGLYLARLVAV